MSIKDSAWILSNSNKLCPRLKRYALQWYRPSRLTPCFMQKIERNIKVRWRKLPVILQLENLEAAAMSVNDLNSLTGCRVKRKLSLINSISIEVNEKQLKELVKNANVKKIWYDSEVRAVVDAASATVKAPELWEMGLTGKGVVIAVLDTGIYEHPDLVGRIKGFKDFIGSRSEAYDDNGHGTHVAGCAAANGSQASDYKGPAPEAELVGIKVLDKMGAGSLSTVIDGVQWCIQQKDELMIRIINLSLGSEAYQSFRDDPVCQAVEKAWYSGIVVCAAAGNSGPDKGTIGSPGIDPVIITVGASNDRSSPDPAGNKVADFSSRGPSIDGLVKPDVLAPGVDIVSLRAPNSFLDKSNKNARVGSWHISLSGTSMATPVCAGVTAQLLQSEGSLTPEQVKEMLMLNATKIPGVDSNSQGAGVIDGHKAVIQPPVEMEEANPLL